MTVYVDSLCDFGWKLRGHPVKNCHMFTDSIDPTELHEMALRIGMKRSWFQVKSLPHYDLTPSRRALAVSLGVVEVDRRRAVSIWRAIRNRRAPAPAGAGFGRK